MVCSAPDARIKHPRSNLWDACGSGVSPSGRISAADVALTSAGHGAIGRKPSGALGI